MMPNKLLPSLLSLTLIVGLGWAAEGIVTVKPQKGVRLSPEDVPIEITPMPFLSGDTLLYENFDGDWGPYGDNPPPGWTIIANGGDNTWNENDWNRYVYEGSYVAYLYWYPYDTGEDILMSPVINCSNYCNVKLTCWTCASYFGGGYDWKIWGSTDGGSTWPYIIRDYGGEGFYGNETFDLDWADGQANTRIRWRGDGYIYNINYWLIDNVQVNGDLRVANDVAVTKILSPPDRPFWSWGDTLYPIAEIKNYGSNLQPSFPVRCRIWDTLNRAIAYDEVMNMGPLNPNEIDTVEFPPFFPTPLEEHFFIDTIRTELSSDENNENDAKFMTYEVTEWGSVWMKTHDGGFENGISFTSPNNEWAVRFAQKTLPNLTLNKVGLWVCSWGVYDYPGGMSIYDWDSITPKYTPRATKEVTIHTFPWPNLYHNIYDFECSVPDSPFVVSYRQLSVTPAYPFVGMDYNEPIDDRDAWLYIPFCHTWATLKRYLGYHCDLGIEAGYRERLIDAALKGFPFPDTLNSDTVINFAIEVKNAGLVARNNIKVNMFFIHDPDGETLFAL
ncbi:MAG: hypothetical protein ABIK39_00700, partial [candidate division WOR-3 bacterium]